MTLEAWLHTYAPTRAIHMGMRRISSARDAAVQSACPPPEGTSLSTALIKWIYHTHLQAQSYGAIQFEHLRRPTQRHQPLRDRRTVLSCVPERPHVADVCVDVFACAYW